MRLEATVTAAVRGGRDPRRITSHLGGGGGRFSFAAYRTARAHVTHRRAPPANLDAYPLVDVQLVLVVIVW